MQANSVQSSKQDTLEQFTKLFRQFLGEIEGVFPECTGTKKCILTYDISITHAPSEAIATKAKEKLIAAWNDHMSPVYDRIERRDSTAIRDITKSHEVFKGLDLWGKWKDDTLAVGTHDCIWEYLSNLNRFCQLHTMCNAVPDSMCRSIESIAKKMQQKMGDAAGPLDSTTIHDIMGVIQNEIKPDDMQNFASAIDPKMLQSLCGGLLGQVVGGAGDATQAKLTHQ